MEIHQKVLFVDATTGFYRISRYPLGPFYGPVDLGLHLAGKFNSLNIGVGLLAGSIFPGSNRLILTGFSPCWGGFFVSSMGGAGLVFDNLGLNMVALVGKAPSPSILYLNRMHGEEIEVRVVPVELSRIWGGGRGGVYALMDQVYEQFSGEYKTDPRVLAVGPAAQATDFGAIGSVPINRGKLTFVDTWAGRGGFGSKMLQQHGIAAIIFGGTFVDEDFRDRKVADEWFQEKYNKKLGAKDVEATVKYRYDPQFDTGGTFGVNFTTLRGRIIAFNYTSIYLDEAQRLSIHEQFILNHYLKQFNEETIQTKQQHTCGEPCPAVCKKTRDEFKKDYEPYQTMGPLCGIFDQRAAERLNHHADMYGFDAISVGGVLAWLMECLSGGLLTPEELGVKGKYYMYYGSEFMPPRKLGRINAQRFRDELILDNLGMCRFHRLWAEEMLPEVMGSLYGKKQEFLERILATASRINSRNASIFWESDRNVDIVSTFLKRHRDVEGDTDKDLGVWIDRFEKDKTEAALEFWYEVHKGTHEVLREF